MSRIIGIDLGERRIGIALADADGAALALTTLRRAREVADDAAAIARLAAVHDARELVVGLPLEASGAEGPQARVTRAWVEAVSPLVRLPVTLRDERLSSHVAEGTARSHEAGPVRWSAHGGPARRPPGPGRPRGRRDHPPGRARRPRPGGGRVVTIRGGGRPRDGGDLSGVDIDEEYYATAPEPIVTGRGRRPDVGRAGGRTPQAPRGSSGFGLGGLLRLVLFIGVLAGIVLIASLTVLRPLVASSVVDWATDNPSALGLPFVAQLVREDLGTALTKPASSDPAEVEFTVLDGDSAASIGTRLQDAGFLSDSRAFVFIATDRHLADQLEAGTYILRKNMTPDQLVNALLVSRDIAVSVGLREGLRLEQITAKLQTLPLKMDVKAFYDEVRNPPKKLLADYPWLDLPKGASLEGYLAPATYRVLPDITPDELIRRMLDRFYDTVGKDRMKVAKDRGLTFYQVLTLASIVEREAVLDDERALIAGVYQNRLDNAPRILNADPTVLYAERHDGAGKAQVRRLEDVLVLVAAGWLAQGAPVPRGSSPATRPTSHPGCRPARSRPRPSSRSTPPLSPTTRPATSTSSRSPTAAGSMPSRRPTRSTRRT